MHRTQRWIRWPEGTHNHTAGEGSNGPIGFGGDYNPEQWPEDVWQEDVRLRRTGPPRSPTEGSKTTMYVGGSGDDDNPCDHERSPRTAAGADPRIFAIVGVAHDGVRLGRTDLEARR